MNNDLISRSEFRRSLIIWAEKLHIAGERGGCEVEFIQAVIRMLDAQATVDAEPMRHGKWLFSDYDYFTCSICGGQYFTGADSTKDAKAMLENNAYYPYCPYCGASMKGEKMNNICNEYEAFWNRAYNLNLYPEYVREKYPAVGEEAGD